MIELSLIKYLLKYENYYNYNSYLKLTDFPEELRIVYTALNSHFSTETTDLGVTDLANLVFSLHPKDKQYYEEFFESLKDYTPVESTVIKLIEAVKKKRILTEVALLSFEVSEGKKEYSQLESLLTKLNSEEDVKEESFVSDDLEVLLNDQVFTSGLSWRLADLNKTLGPLRKGDFGFIFARPETGKTTFLASEVSNFLTQTEGNILWCNNEEQGAKVMIRVYQAFFGVTLQELYGNIQHYRKLFTEQTAGRFKLYDNAKIDKSTVETLCKRLNPALIIFDQLDKVEGFKAERDDLLLGAKYQWARELAKQYGPVVGVCQADGTGENVRWLTMAHVANAKTAKQAEADFILGIGAIHDPGWESVRFINISKNKLMGSPDTDPELKHAKLTVSISPGISRYT